MHPRLYNLYPSNLFYCHISSFTWSSNGKRGIGWSVLDFTFIAVHLFINFVLYAERTYLKIQWNASWNIVSVWLAVDSADQTFAFSLILYGPSVTKSRSYYDWILRLIKNLTTFLWCILQHISQFESHLDFFTRWKYFIFMLFLFSFFWTFVCWIKNYLIDTKINEIFSLRLLLIDHTFSHFLSVGLFVSLELLSRLY